MSTASTCICRWPIVRCQNEFVRQPVNLQPRMKLFEEPHVLDLLIVHCRDGWRFATYVCIGGRGRLSRIRNKQSAIALVVIS